MNLLKFSRVIPWQALVTALAVVLFSHVVAAYAAVVTNLEGESQAAVEAQQTHAVSEDPAGAKTAPPHPGLMTPLTADCEFPRFTSQQLQASGYPDHMHAFYWPGWEPPRDADGVSYGPKTMCHGMVVLEKGGQGWQIVSLQ